MHMPIQIATEAMVPKYLPGMYSDGADRRREGIAKGNQ